jgi:hypothetical protein
MRPVDRDQVGKIKLRSLSQKHDMTISLDNQIVKQNNSKRKSVVEKTMTTCSEHFILVHIAEIK